MVFHHQHQHQLPSTMDVAAGLVVRGGLLLACQRRPDQPHPGKWEFPGGKRTPRETLSACLRRELREELGIDARIGRRIWQVHHDADDGPLRLTFFHVTSFRGRIRNRAFAELCWGSPTSLQTLDWLELDRMLLERLAGGQLPA